MSRGPGFREGSGQTDVHTSKDVGRGSAASSPSSAEAPLRCQEHLKATGTSSVPP